MPRRGQRTSFPERLEIAERAAAGQAAPAIAAALGCSVWTVRQWRRIGRPRGRAGLTSRMGRPATGPVSTRPAALRAALLPLRRAHPGRGPDTLRAAGRAGPRRADQPLPRRSRMAAPLKSARRPRRDQRHRARPEPPPRPEAAPHDEGEREAQGGPAGGRRGQSRPHHHH